MEKLKHLKFIFQKIKNSNFFKSNTFKFLKLGVGIFIFTMFLLSIDFEKIKSLINQITWYHIMAILVLSVLRNIIATWRFKILLSNNYNISFSEILHQYFVASFYNNILPSALGGDAVRMVLLSKSAMNKSAAIITITIERLIGLYALIVIAFISFWLWNTPDNWRILISGTFIAFTLLILFLYFFKLNSKNNTISNIYSAINVLKNNTKALSLSFILSIVFQMISIFINFYLAKAINYECKMIHFMTIVPIVWFFTMIPISFGGIGLREVSFTYLLSYILVSAEESMIISIGTYMTLVFCGLIGLLLMAIRFIKRK